MFLISQGDDKAFLKKIRLRDLNKASNVTKGHLVRGVMGGKGGVAVQRSPFTAVVRVRFPAGAICELSLFDVLFSPLPRGFFLRVLRFFLPQQKSTCELSVVCKIFNVEVVSVR